MPASPSTVALACLTLAAAAHARPEIGPDNFSGSETRINFDGLVGGSTVLFGEVIENQFAPVGVIFHNPDFQNRANVWPSNQHPGHTAPNTMFVDQDGTITPGVRPLELLFTLPVNRIGLYLAGSQNTTYSIRVYGTSGLMESLTRPGITTAAGTHIYPGIERPERIVRVEVSAVRPQPGIGPANFFVDDVQFEPWPHPCYANCDGFGGLTANDFQCFITAYVQQQAYANCDGTTTAPAFTPNDFQCFLDRYVAGCS